LPYWGMVAVLCVLMLVGFVSHFAGLFVPEHVLALPDVRSRLWSQFSWLSVSYAEHGFIRRGVIASLYNALPEGARAGAMAVLYGAVHLAIALVVAWFLRRASEVLPRADAVVLALLLVASPMSFVELGWLVGRYDPVNMLLIFGALAAVRRGHRVLAVLIVLLAMLIHEGVLFYGVPVVLLYASYRSTPPGASFGLGDLLAGAGVLAGMAVPVAALGAVLLLFGDIEAEGYVPGAWGRPVLQPLSAEPETLAVLIVIMAASMALMLRVWRANFARFDLFLLVPLPVICLFALGVDWSRWCAIFYWVCLLVIALMVLEGRVTRVAPRSVWGRLALVPLLALPLGPLGHVIPFPLIDDAGKLLGLAP